MEDKTYDCLTCPYPRHKTPELIFCDVCIRKIMDEHYDDKRTNSGIASNAFVIPQRHLSGEIP